MTRPSLVASARRARSGERAADCTLPSVSDEARNQLALPEVLAFLHGVPAVFEQLGAAEPVEPALT